jgi:hypothetical protein
MIRILEVEQSFAISFFQQFAQHFLPHPAALVVEQPPVTGLIGGPDVVGHILPAAARREDVQNAIKHFPVIAPGTDLSNQCLVPRLVAAEV